MESARTRMIRKSGSVMSNLNISGVFSGGTSGCGCDINGGCCDVGNTRICGCTIGVCVVSNNSTKRTSRGVSSYNRSSGYYG